MKILVDMSNLAIASVQAVFGRANSQDFTMDESTIRHVILSNLMSLHKKLGRHAELILCFDGSSPYWKKDIFPYYKANRVKSSDFDWETYFKLYTDFKKELPNYFKYKCIEIPKVEGDDCIYVLIDHFLLDNPHEQIVLCSSDKDYLQIQEKHEHVKQYSFKKKSFITPIDYEYSLFEHIIKGDKGDGVPSIISPADIFLQENVRQSPITKKKLDQFAYIIPEEHKARYEINKTIIDMNNVPENYKNLIIEEYNKDVKREGNAIKYCIKYRLNKLLKELG